MARPITSGLSYFSIDTDIFHDRRVRRLLRVHGSNGWLIYTYLLTEIYRDKGFFIAWDKNVGFDISDALDLEESIIVEVVNFCCDIGLFNQEKLNQEKILTSKSIQVRWEKISKDARRRVNSTYQINPNYSLMQEETELIPTLTKITPTLTPKTPTISTHSIVKDSIEKDSKENNTFTNVNILEKKFEKNEKNETMETNLNNSSGENKKEKVASKRKTFVSPTIDEIVDYCNERKNNINATTFWNFYESKGWLVGKTKMKDWKAAIRTWESKEKTNKSQSFSTSNCIRERRASELLGGQN